MKFELVILDLQDEIDSLNTSISRLEDYRQTAKIKSDIAHYQSLVAEYTAAKKLLEKHSK